MVIERPTVAIIDYEMGNLFSVTRVCDDMGLNPIVTNSPDIIKSAAGVILPGVGAFGDAMTNLERLGLISPLTEFIEENRPFLGICLGFQLLLSESEEFGNHKGLNVVKGTVNRFPGVGITGRRSKVPHVGWNTIRQGPNTSKSSWERSLLAGIAEGSYVYFVHSYYVQLQNDAESLTVTTYEGTTYCSSIQRRNLFACQFHPEKSGEEGLKIYRNFSKIVKQGSIDNG